MEKKSSYILSLEAKDIINAGTDGYKTEGYKRYKATFDYCLDASKLDEICQDAFYCDDKSKKQYCNAIISVQFNYKTKNMNTSQLREKLYRDGFKCNGEKFVRYKRSSGSARVGKCLFIKDALYSDMMDWSMMGIHIPNTGYDMAAMEAYIALTTSSIIDTIQKIRPENILLIDDYTSTFKDTVMATEIVDGKLKTIEKEIEIDNTIWDGQSLMDESLFGEKYKDKGMLLLRNRFFKSACFNTNIQHFFEDNGITDISQLNGLTIAKDIADIKLITTPSSIKYLKFSTFDKWIGQIESTFGIVKYDKPSHFFKGDMVQANYQILNTLQLLGTGEVKAFMQPSMDYIYKLKNDLRVFRNHISSKVNVNNEGTVNSTNDFILKMLSASDRFAKTDIFIDYRRNIVNNWVTNLKQGHVLVNGTYATLFGNPYEMLCASVKKIETIHPLKGSNIHCSNFDYGNQLLGARSPHITMGNLWLCRNVESDILDRYFNLTRQIVCINSINNNVLCRLNGSDFDSDTLLLTDNNVLVDSASVNYSKFFVPVANLSIKDKVKIKRKNTPEEKADLDIKTSKSLIGEVVNLSQILNSALWDKYNTYGVIDTDIYADICTLAVMSGFEIDKAKKEVKVNTKAELKRLKVKYKDYLRPIFFKCLKSKYKCNFDYREYATTMDYIVSEILEKMKEMKSKSIETIELTKLLSPTIRISEADRKQIGRIYKSIKQLKAEQNDVWKDKDKESTKKYEESNALYNECIEEWRGKVKAATIKKIIKLCYEETDNFNAIRRKTMTILFEANKVEFLKVLTVEKEPIQTIRRCDYCRGKKGSVMLFDFNFIVNE